ncbi:MAG: H-X9-DG-CTERM domain-containing protein [Candidatus Berkelbacteria bacterium]
MNHSVLPVTIERLHRHTCLSNLRQLGIASLSYTEDWDGKLPGAVPSQGQFGCWVRCTGPWMYTSAGGALDPYIKNTEIFTCPSEPALSLGYGAGLLHPGRIGSIPKPAEMRFYGDSPMGVPYVGRLMSTRHEGGGNCVYLDGHAKWRLPSSKIESKDVFFTGGTTIFPVKSN